MNYRKNFGAQSRMANVFRTVGRTTIIYKSMTAARLCTVVAWRRSEETTASSSANVTARQTKQCNVWAMPKVATLSRHRTDERAAVGRQADATAWQSARGDFAQMAKASSSVVVRRAGLATWRSGYSRLARAADPR